MTIRIFYAAFKLLLIEARVSVLTGAPDVDVNVVK
jgi:hypothetical protein